MTIFKPLMQCHILEPLSGLGCDQSGCFLFGGSKSGRIFVWGINTGRLIRSWQAHYKSVTRLRVTSCDSFLISCSEDGIVKIWDICVIASDPFSDHSVHSTSTSTSIPSYRLINTAKPSNTFLNLSYL